MGCTPALKVNGMYTGLESKWDIPALKVNGIYRLESKWDIPALKDVCKMICNLVYNDLM